MSVFKHLKKFHYLLSLIYYVIVVFYIAHSFNLFISTLLIILGFILFALIYNGYSIAGNEKEEGIDTSVPNETYLKILGILGALAIAFWVPAMAYFNYLIIKSSVWLLTKILSITAMGNVLWFIYLSLKSNK